MRAWSVFAVFALVGCVPEETQVRVVRDIETPPTIAQHFTVFTVAEGHRLLVFGDSAHADTISDFVVPRGGLQRIAVLSTTHLPYLSTLGTADRVVAAAQLEQVRDTATKERYAAGQVMEIGTADGVDREALIAVAPEVLLGYPFGRSVSDTAVTGVPLLMIAEYLEPHPLGRAEWLKFFGVLVGKADLADSLYAGIARRYEAARADVQPDRRPNVLFGSYWNGQWWVPPGNSYMAQLIEDAGGDYLFSDRRGKENIAVDLETMISLGEQVDVWGIVTSSDLEISYPDFHHGDGRVDHIKAYVTHRLFYANSAVSDLFGKAVLQPDLVLNDLTYCLMTEPSRYPAKRTNPYFNPLAPLRIDDDVEQVRN